MQLLRMYKCNANVSVRWYCVGMVLVCAVLLCWCGAITWCYSGHTKLLRSISCLRLWSIDLMAGFSQLANHIEQSTKNAPERQVISQPKVSAMFPIAGADMIQANLGARITQAATSRVTSNSVAMEGITRVTTLISNRAIKIAMRQRERTAKLAVLWQGRASCPAWIALGIYFKNNAGAQLAFQPIGVPLQLIAQEPIKTTESARHSILEPKGLWHTIQSATL